jgi:hypothetical protein
MTNETSPDPNETFSVSLTREQVLTAVLALKARSDDYFVMAPAIVGTPLEPALAAEMDSCASTICTLVDAITPGEGARMHSAYLADRRAQEEQRLRLAVGRSGAPAVA